MFFFLLRVCIFSETEDFSSFWKPGCGQWANRTEEKEQKKYFFVALQGKVRCVSEEAKKTGGNVRNLIRNPRPHLHFPHLFRHSAIRNLFFASLAASVIEFLLQFSPEILSCFSWKKRETSESTHTPFFIYCGSRFFLAPQAKAKQAGGGVVETEGWIVFYGGGRKGEEGEAVVWWRDTSSLSPSPLFQSTSCFLLLLSTPTPPCLRLGGLAGYSMHFLRLSRCKSTMSIVYNTGSNFPSSQVKKLKSYFFRCCKLLLKTRVFSNRLLFFVWGNHYVVWEESGRDFFLFLTRFNCSQCRRRQQTFLFENARHMVSLTVLLIFPRLLEGRENQWPSQSRFSPLRS